ncbi:MAG: hypothetical protein DRJ51_05765 [Thermoprotei archaeon]|nr:MAG: hypothetical protein DRJ51_05765 [Thermoprotei archaeon]RLF01645.1 MAG: hypothetical protein DRJ59_05600 [Thermoprotei archaeon]
MFVALRDLIIKHANYPNLFKALEELGANILEIRVERDLRPVEYVSGSLRESFGISIREVEDWKSFGKCLEDHGYGVCALLSATNFSSEDLESEAKYLAGVCKVAYALGVRVVRVDGPKGIIEGYGVEDYVNRTLRGLEGVFKICKDLDIVLAIENHGLITNQIEYLRGVLEATDERYFGITLDTGNFYWYGYPLDEVYEMYRELAPRVRHTHIKNACAPRGKENVRRKPREVTMAPLYEGDIDLKLLARILKEAGYDYDLTVEDESLGRYSTDDRKRILARDVAFLKGLL